MTILKLEHDEALIIYAALSKLGNSAETERLLDAEELQSLWDLEAALEQQLSDVVSPDYFEALAAAKKRKSMPSE